MDAEKKIEDSEQPDKAQEESSLPEAVPEDHSNKRKLSETGDSDNDQDAKKMKMEEEEEEVEKQEVSDGGEDSAKKEDAAGETEEDKDQKPDEKPPSPAVKEEVKDEGGDKEEESAEPAGQSQEDDEAMDVEESTAEKDTVLEEDKEEKEEKPQNAEKKESNEESNEESKEESQSDKSDPKPASESEEKEEKTEVVQRRYPMRHRRVEDKAASQSAKASGSTPDSKKSGSSGTSREDDSHKGTRAGSVKSDSGSDKENMNSDMAADVGNADTPDVIMLSEEEETEQSKEKKAKKRKLVRRLQAHLRNEEAKLVLLKKLRQSQLTPQVQDHTPVSNSSSSQLSKQATPRQQGGPPPLVRGGQQVRGSSLHLQQQQQQSRTPSQGQMRNMQGPPPLVVTPRMGSGSSGANGHGGQNLRNNTPHLNQHGSASLRPVQQQPATTPQHQQSATPPQVDTQTPAQRQAAAKLALRKQLEKTLLQIPPPKPPAPEMNFIPSLACPDFVLLLGLEEVVNHIIDLQLIARGQKSPDEKFICNPFTCVQCNTDYTPVWKREKPGSKNVICEHCVTWNQKRALKQEHTNRLKSAFVKALQQEQEIERMQAQTPSNPSTPTPTPSGTPPTSTSAPPQALAAAAAASNVAAAAAMSMSPASFRHSAEQVRQHHNFLQAQAQLRAGQPLPGLQGFGPRSTFPYNLPYVKQADLQRQYLLDLMPRTAGMPWKQ